MKTEAMHCLGFVPQLGFFRRKDKARLERLKRQSGFYEGRGRSMKKSQGASGTGNDGAEAEKQ